MKRMNLVFAVLLLASFTWAMYERSSKDTLSQKVQRLESEYLKKTKDSNFLQDKVNSLEEKEIETLMGLLSKHLDKSITELPFLLAQRPLPSIIIAI